MQLSLDLLVENLYAFDPRPVFSGERAVEFRGVRKLSSAAEEMDPSIIYVCEPSVIALLRDEVFSRYYFVFRENGQVAGQERVRGVEVAGGVRLNDVMNCLMALFRRFDLLEYRVREAALSRGNMQPFFDIAAAEFPNDLVIASDPSFNIVGASAASVDDEYINGILTRGYLSTDDLNRMAKVGYYEDERKYEVPILYDATQTVCGYPWLVRSYKSGDTAYSFVGCYFLKKPPSLTDIALFTCFSSAVQDYYTVNGVADSQVASVQPILEELIDPKQNDPDYFRDCCSKLHIPFNGPFRLGLIKSEINRKIKSSQILNQLRLHCPLNNYGKFLNDTYVLILFADWSDSRESDKAAVEKAMETLSATLAVNKASIGISTPFSNISKFCIGYKQALAAVNFGHDSAPEKTIHMFSDYYLEDMMECYSGRMPLDTVYVRYLDRIIKNNSGVCSNLQLLYYYLSSERNLSLTAKRANMHRNSAFYRIQKITDLLSLNMEDPDVRLRLMLSIKILKLIGKGPVVSAVD